MSTYDRTVAFKGVAVTPNDSADLPNVAKGGLYVTVAGNLAFHDAGGEVWTLLAVPAFTRIPVQARRVLATGTAATVKALC